MSFLKTRGCDFRIDRCRISVRLEYVCCQKVRGHSKSFSLFDIGSCLISEQCRCLHAVPEISVFEQKEGRKDSSACTPRFQSASPNASVRVSTKQIESLQVSASRHEPVRVSTSQYESVRVSTCSTLGDLPRERGGAKPTDQYIMLIVGYIGYLGYCGFKVRSTHFSNVFMCRPKSSTPRCGSTSTLHP